MSAATDNKMCVWDKFSGNLLNTISQHHSVSKNIVLLAPNVLVTAKEDRLVIWDIGEGEPLRIIALDSGSKLNSSGRTAGLCERQSYIKNLSVCSQSRVVACESGSDLCLVHFPGVTEKFD